MSIPNLPGRLSADHLERLRRLGDDVRSVLALVGIPVVLEANPYVPPVTATGAHIYVDPTAADVVCIRWECGEELDASALAASTEGNYDSAEVRLVANARLTMAEAIGRILNEVGYDTGVGVDMADDHVWAKGRV